MLNLVPILFVIGVLIGLLSGLFSAKCYFYLTGNSVESLYKHKRPHIWKMVKQYKKNREIVKDERLKNYFNWIFYTRQISIIFLISALILYVVAFAV